MVSHFSIAPCIPPTVRRFLRRLICPRGKKLTGQRLSQLPQNLAARYVDWQIHTHQGGRGIEVPWVLRHVGENSAHRVLDVGCVNFDPPWSRVCTERYLLDIDNFLVCVDRRMPFHIGKHYRFCQADARNLPFRDVFDSVLCISVLEHIGLLGYGQEEVDTDADKSAFLEMIRVLRPGGKLLLTVPFGAEMIHDGWIRSYTRLRLDSLLDQAEMAGYVVYEEEGSYFMNTVQGWIHSTAEELQTTRQYEGMADICGLYCGVFRKQ